VFEKGREDLLGHDSVRTQLSGGEV
jgi:hypothetical protein